jgi:uncharacterized FAD-dependent dehydrogenase
MKEFESAFGLCRELSREQLEKAACRALGVQPSRIGDVAVLRRSLDCRGGDPQYRFQIRAYQKGEPVDTYQLPEYKDVFPARRVIVIGCGPAGMFASLRLMMEGLKPIILERGKDVHSRKKDCASISRTGAIDPDSNYCFGEGGAGTFSDGKLYTRSTKRGDIREVLHQFVRFGADPDILVDAHPHIGSDVLPRVVENIRLCIEEHGGECHFNARVTDFQRTSSSDGSGCWKVICADGSSYEAADVILAAGHSATEFYELFDSRGWALQAKGFALGVRAEHPQSLIDRIQYHGHVSAPVSPAYGRPASSASLPAAEYSLLTQIQGRGVFSFCMCPGGVLVPSSTQEGEVVLNGMSNSMRSSHWANAGIVSSVEPGDFPEYAKYGALELLRFQKDVERRMWDFSKSFKAPAQRMTDFCHARLSRNLPDTSYACGVECAPLHLMLPKPIAERLAEAFPVFDLQMKGYYNGDALLLAVESRTSSPVRIPRNPDTLQSLSLPRIYPAGEGAGYAGGIVSSAIDGIACAKAIAHPSR